MITTQHISSMYRYARYALVASFCLSMVVCSLWLQTNRAQTQSGLTVTATFNAETSLTPDTPLELHLSRPLKPEEGRITVMMDRVDVTSLFIIDGARLVYSPTLVPLPLGEIQLILYLVGKDDSWRELERFQLRVAKDKLPPTASPTA